MAPLALVAILATKWHRLHWLQILPPDGTICIGSKFDHQMAPLNTCINSKFLQPKSSNWLQNLELMQVAAFGGQLYN